MISKALFDLDKQSARFFQYMPIATINIYTTDGVKLFSTQDQTIDLYSKHPSASVSAPSKTLLDDKLFLTSLTGIVSTSTIKNGIIKQAGGVTLRGLVIRSFVPIMRDNSAVPEVSSYNQPGEMNIACSDTNVLNCVEGVVEVRYNASGQLRNLDMFRQITTAAIIIAFIIAVFLLFLTSKKAETTIIRLHKTNTELAAQIVSARAENRDKSQFLANVSHELRTPLNAIVGFAEFIKLERSGRITNKKYTEYIKDIYASGVHLLSLINDILLYSKAEADKLELDISEIDVKKLIRNSLRAVRPQADIGLVHLKEELVGGPLVIKSDSKKLRQVVLNLLNNAVKFTPTSGVVTITAWQNTADGSVSVEIKDTGIGMAPKDIPHAVTPFGQFDSTIARKHKGTGLGLPLARKLVDVMGGTFNIHSELGKGTAVVICLPKEIQNKNIVL